MDKQREECCMQRHITQQQQLMQQQFIMEIMVMMSRRNLSAFPPTISQIQIITILVKVIMKKEREGKEEE